MAIAASAAALCCQHVFGSPPAVPAPVPAPTAATKSVVLDTGLHKMSSSGEFRFLSRGGLQRRGLTTSFAMKQQQLQLQAARGRYTRRIQSAEFVTWRFGSLSSKATCGRVGGSARKHRSNSTVCVVSDTDVEVVESTGADTRIPVTVITGFLGSGKTTLLNHILTAQHGKRIAVIENEFGEIDIDGGLVASKLSGAEDILLLNNGCLCCTVRGDLLRMLSELLIKKRGMFDHVIVETTGLANPLPIIQTFFFEEELAQLVKLDGVVTLVDVKHVVQHIEEVKPEGVVNEAVEQIAYADRIILNKTDLVEEAEVATLSRTIKRINGLASMKQARYGVVDVDYVIGVGGYELERIDAEVESGARSTTSHDQSEQGHDHGHHGHHGHDHDYDSPDEHEHDHGHAEGHSHDHADHHNHHDHTHTHDPGVSSVSIVCGGNVDVEKVNDWLEDLLGGNQETIYRMKGVLSIEGFDSRFVFQGVHSLFDGAPDRPWAAGEDRTNKMVFIGRNLDDEALRSGFKTCLA